MPKPYIPEQAKRLIAAARASPHKGDYSMYNQYCRRLETMGLNPAQYETVVKRLASAFKV